MKKEFTFRIDLTRINKLTIGYLVLSLLVLILPIYRVKNLEFFTDINGFSALFPSINPGWLYLFILVAGILMEISPDFSKYKASAYILPVGFALGWLILMLFIRFTSDGSGQLAFGFYVGIALHIGYGFLEYFLSVTGRVEEIKKPDIVEEPRKRRRRRR